MIIAVVVFLSAGQPVYSMRSRDTFQTVAACRAFLEADEPRLFAIAMDASIRAGRAVTFATSCIGGGSDT
jgi:hypothetical protein